MSRPMTGGQTPREGGRARGTFVGTESLQPPLGGGGPVEGDAAAALWGAWNEAAESNKPLDRYQDRGTHRSRGISPHS